MRVLFAPTLAPILALLLALSLVACGKRGPPQPAGPPDQVTYPRTYPAR
jgi:predicted small lipoprotein YifL